jgi:hypothetical protein
MSFSTLRAATLALALGGLAACSTSDPLNTAGRPDGAPGNPPGTEVSRANDRAGDPLNTAGRPDGTPGNPPGTAVSRALGTTDAAPAASTRRTRAERRRAAARRPATGRATTASPAAASNPIPANPNPASPGSPPNVFSTQGN